MPDLSRRNGAPPGQHAVIHSIDERLNRWTHDHARALPLIELREPEPVPERKVRQADADGPVGADGARDIGIAQPADERLQPRELGFVLGNVPHIQGSYTGRISKGHQVAEGQSLYD